MLNQIQTIGRVGKDPEVRYLPSGEAVANFSVATTEKWKDKQSGELREETEWFRISTFGRLAEIVGEYVKKGALVYVSGKLKTRKYTDKDGVEKITTEVRASDMKMLSGRNDGQQHGDTAGHARPAPQRQQSQQRPAPTAQGSGFDDMDDDIPF